MHRPLTVLAHAVALVTMCSALAHAQSSNARTPGFELLIPSGTFVPTGAQDDDVKGGNLTAVQVSYGLRPDLVLTGTLGWARARPVGMGSDARLDVLTYDVGAECRLPRRSADRRVNFKPFTGVGLGARTYSFRHADVAATHNLAAYVAAGGELGLSRVRVRVEVRDYLTWVTPSGSSARARRNDVAVLAGLRLSLR